MTLASDDALACSLSILPKQEVLVYDVAHGCTVFFELANDVLETFRRFAFDVGERFENFDRVVADSC